MIAGNAWAYADDFCSYAGKPPAELSDEEYWGMCALDRCYEAGGESYVCVSIHRDADFRRLAEIIGDAGLADDPRFATADARVEHDADLVATLETLFAARPAAEWERVCVDAGVGCVEVSMAGQAMTTSFDPALREAGLTVAFDHPLFGEMVRAAVPVTFSQTPGRLGPPCRRGEQNRSILTELGYSEIEIDALEASGVVAAPDPSLPLRERLRGCRRPRVTDRRACLRHDSSKPPCRSSTTPASPS